MNIEFNLGTIIVFALIAQGIFASAVLFFKEDNRRANTYLALLIITLVLWLCDAFFRISGIYQQNPDFYFLPIYFSLGFGPLIYFYTKSLTRGAVPFSLRDARHFVPMLIQFLFYIFLQTTDYSFRRAFWFNVHKPYTYDIELILSFLGLLIYLLASRRLILRYKRKIENAYSSIHQITLNWLGSLHLLLGVLTFFWLLEALGRLIWSSFSITPFSFITIGVTLLMMAVGGLLQKDLGAITDSIRPAPNNGTTGKDPITIDAGLVKKVQSMMTEKKLFLRQELTIKEFAKELRLAPRDVSQIINQGLGMSFIEFVNHYRIERFKLLVKDSSLNYLNLMGLALESGFNSKSTFNRVFKKKEGKSPSEYQKSIQNTK